MQRNYKPTDADSYWKNGIKSRNENESKPKKDYSMSCGCIFVWKCRCYSQTGGPRSRLPLKGLAVLSVAQRWLSLLGDAATHASVQWDYFQSAAGKDAWATIRDMHFTLLVMTEWRLSFGLFYRYSLLNRKEEIVPGVWSCHFGRGGWMEKP